MVVVESLKLSESLGQNESAFLDVALNRYLERYCLAEPTVLAFVEEQGQVERIDRESESLRDRFTDRANQHCTAYPIGVKDLFHIDGLPIVAGSELHSSVLIDVEGSLIRCQREQGEWILVRR